MLSRLVFNCRQANQLWFNTTILRRRNFDGFLVSTQQSGRHLIIYMLGHCLADLHNKQPPETIHDQRFVGNPRRKPGPAYPDLPQLVSSHALPHIFMYHKATPKLLRFPKYLIFIRDMRHSLVSGYEKWKDIYSVDFSTFLKSSPLHKRYRFANDIWRQMEFFNTWSRIASDESYDTLTVKYEDLVSDKATVLSNICRHFNINASPELVQRAVASSTKEKMAEKNTIKLPGYTIVRQDKRHPFEWYSKNDRELFEKITQTHLKHAFGYDYSDWTV